MDSIQAYYFGTLRLVLGMNYPNHNNGGNRYPLSKSFLLEKVFLTLILRKLPMTLAQSLAFMHSISTEKERDFLLYFLRGMYRFYTNYDIYSFFSVRTYEHEI